MRRTATSLKGHKLRIIGLAQQFSKSLIAINVRLGTD